MRKRLIVAIALAIAITVTITPACAQAVKGYGSIMGGMWGCGPGCGINGYGLGIFGGLNPCFPFAGCGPAGFGGCGYGMDLPFNSMGPGFPFAGRGL